MVPQVFQWRQSWQYNNSQFATYHNSITPIVATIPMTMISTTATPAMAPGEKPVDGTAKRF